MKMVKKKLQLTTVHPFVAQNSAGFSIFNEHKSRCFTRCGMEVDP